MTVGDSLAPVSVSGFEFLGEVTFATGFEFEGTEVGGLSGLSFDAEADSYFAIADDRGSNGDPRFYTLTIDLSDGTLDTGDVEFTDVVTLLADDGEPFELNETDFEGIALTPIGTLAIASERNDLPGETGQPQVFAFSTAGEQLVELGIPDRYIPDAAFDAEEPRTQGVRDNLAFESLTITPNGQSLFTATENALVQDGPEATTTTNSLARIIQFDTATDEPVAEFFYEVEPVPNEPVPADAFSTNGLVELLALDNAGNFLALERAFSVGVGNTVRLFQVDISDALPISGVEALADADGEVLFDLFGAVEKTLILDVEADLGVTPDNLEALAFGPVLEDGSQSLIIASDNNFNDVQETQFLAVALDLETGAPDTLVNGIASGDTTADSTVLWARSLALGEVTFEYSTDPTFATIDGTATAEVTDALLPVRVEIEDLDSNTEYFYRVTDAAGDSEEGRFATAAEVGEFAGLNFGVAGDWRGEISPYPAIANVPDLNLDFFIEHGDTIYADFDSPALLDAEGNRQEQAITLEDFRIRHAEVYGERLGANFFADLRASTSILATIDDHEVINDFAGGATTGSDDEGPGGSNRFLEAFPDDDPNALQNDSTLFENGLQSFQEYNPLREEFYGDTGDDRTAFERELYRNNTYGSDAATFVLDNRSFRDEALDDPDPATLAIDIASGTPVPEAFGNFVVNEVIPFETAAFDASRTLLGDEQLNDFLDDLLEAQENGVTWKFVAVPEPFQTLGPLLGPADRFDGYLAERTLIAEFIVENEIENVVFISADLHGTIVNNVTYQETPGGPQLPTGIIDIVTGSIGFDAPFGQSVVAGSTAAGFVTPEEFGFYSSLPAIADPVEGQITGQDDFLIDLLNNTALTPFGLDPVGLDDNLPQADGLIDAELLQGRYVAAHTFGWTQFEVDEETQVLTVTTYGIEPYQEEAGLTLGLPVFDEDNNIRQSPEDILGREPVIVSQFTVTPQGFVADGTAIFDEAVVADLSLETATTGIGFIGEVGLDTGTIFTDDTLGDTEIGGLSGLEFDPATGSYFALADDQVQPQRFYTLDLILEDDTLTDVVFTDAVQVLDSDGEPFADFAVDPESIRLGASSTGEGLSLYFSSETGGGPEDIDDEVPFISEIDFDGNPIRTFELPDGFALDDGGTPDDTSDDIGIRNNLAFESLTFTPSGEFVFTATENALFQDGPAASVDAGSPSRIIQYDAATGTPVAQFVYITEAIPDEPIPADAFATNGLVEMLAISETQFLFVERAFSVGVGNTVQVFLGDIAAATDVSELASIEGEDIVAVEKTFLFDTASFGITPDNLEGITFGPELEDGTQSFFIVSDNNFNPGQFTQFLGFNLEGDILDVEVESLADVANLTGSEFDDFLTGDEGDNIITGNGGDDFLNGGLGSNVLDGGEGTDIAAFAGDLSDFDIEIAEDGTITVADGDSSNTLTGIEILSFTDGDVAAADLAAPDPADSPVVGTADADSIVPGIDIDAIAATILTGAGDDSVDLALASGEGVGNNIVLLGSGADEVSVTTGDIVSGGSGDDIFFAEDSLGDNRASGGAGNDTFFLGAGGDTFLGGAGDDTFFFDESEGNVVSGGSGSDTFFLGGPGDVPAVANLITDFDVAEDLFAGVGFDAVTFDGSDVLIGEDVIATLIGVDASVLTEANFA